MVNPRVQYSSIIERPKLALPDGARLAVWPVINVEEWDISGDLEVRKRTGHDFEHRERVHF